MKSDERSSLAWSWHLVQIHRGHVIIGTFSTNLTDHMKPRKTFLFPIDEVTSDTPPIVLEGTPQCGMKGLQLISDEDGPRVLPLSPQSTARSSVSQSQCSKSNQWLCNRLCVISVTLRVGCLSGKRLKRNCKTQLWEQQCSGEMRNYNNAVVSHSNASTSSSQATHWQRKSPQAQRRRGKEKPHAGPQGWIEAANN